MKLSGFNPQRLDPAIRFFLYALIFWIPYSKAVIETCVASALFLWMIKHLWLCWNESRQTGRSKPLIAYLKPALTPLNQAIFFFLLACLVSTMFSFFWERSMRGLFSKTLEWFIIYFITVEVINERKHVFTALGVLVFTALATSLDAISQYFWIGRDIFYGFPVTVDNRATGAFPHPNALGGFLIIVIPVVVSGLFLKEKGRVGKVIPFLLAVMILALVLSFSRASWLSVTSALLFFIFIAMKRMFAKATIVISLVGLILAALFFNSYSLRKEFRLNYDNIHMTTTWRWGLWKDSLEMIKEKPLLGHGLNTYMMLFQEYRSQISGATGKTWSPTYAHNSFIQLTAETGLLSLAMFGWILGGVFYYPLQAKRREDQGQGSEFQDLKIIMLGCLAAVLAFCIHGLAENNFYSLQLSSLFWVMVGLVFSSVKLLNKAEPCDIKRHA